MKWLLPLAITLSLTLASCVPAGDFSQTSGASNDEALSSRSKEKLTITATLFPQYDFVKAVAGDKAEVMLLLPPGVESHTFDPAPSDILKIHDSDIFLYTGAEMEPWAQRVISATSQKTTVIDVCAGIELFYEEHEDGYGEEHDEAYTEEHDYDPHIWLDLRKAAQILDNIANALCEIDAENAGFYRENADAYKRDLLKLDEEFESMISSSKRDTLVFGGRFAYQYFLKRYDLHYVTAYDTCSSVSEPSVIRVADVIDYVTSNSIPVIYHEEFVDPKIARSIAEQSGAELELFSTAHNVTKDEFLSGASFIDIMRRNFDNVKRGLN